MTTKRYKLYTINGYCQHRLDHVKTQYLLLQLASVRDTFKKLCTVRIVELTKWQRLNMNI